MLMLEMASYNPNPHFAAVNLAECLKETRGDFLWGVAGFFRLGTRAYKSKQLGGQILLL